MSGGSEPANGQASGPVLTSLFLVVLNHGAPATSRSLRVEEEDGLEVVWWFGKIKRQQPKSSGCLAQPCGEVAGGVVVYCSLEP